MNSDLGEPPEQPAGDGSGAPRARTRERRESALEPPGPAAAMGRAADDTSNEDVGVKRARPAAVKLPAAPPTAPTPAAPPAVPSAIPKPAAAWELRAGDKVEVRMLDEGWEGSWYSATVLSARGKSIKVRYDSVNDDFDKPIEVAIETSDVRPLPPPPPAVFARELTPGDFLELSEQDGWWDVELRTMRKGKFIVHAELYDVEHEATQTRLRPKWVWTASVGKGASEAGDGWTFAIGG
ncbi:hypothetical protein T492DRAFT_5911 [Pavlovales sp. CCMP2436]|nr:hypothetical protein T492DRAFT_5911 [Pavlovales sp. CCMP2436]